MQEEAGNKLTLAPTRDPRGHLGNWISEAALILRRSTTNRQIVWDKPQKPRKSASFGLSKTC